MSFFQHKTHIGCCIAYHGGSLEPIKLSQTDIEHYWVLFIDKLVDQQQLKLLPRPGEEHELLFFSFTQPVAPCKESLEFFSGAMTMIRIDGNLEAVTVKTVKGVPVNIWITVPLIVTSPSQLWTLGSCLLHFLKVRENNKCLQIIIIISLSYQLPIWHNSCTQNLHFSNL